MRARDAMIPNPLCLPPHTTLLEFIRAVLGTNQTTAAIVDDGRLLGIVSVEDVFRRLLPLYADLHGQLAGALHHSYFEEAFDRFKDARVDGVMSTDIDALGPDDPVMHAVHLFVHNYRKMLPVLDQGRFLGCVTRRSVLAAVTRVAGR